MNKYIFAILFSVLSSVATAQISGQPQRGAIRSSIAADSLSYLNPKLYTIGDVTVTGYKNLDPVNYKNILKQKADSMQKNMMHVYESANYFIRKNNFLYE